MLGTPYLEDNSPAGMRSIALNAEGVRSFWAAQYPQRQRVKRIDTVLHERQAFHRAMLFDPLLQFCRLATQESALRSTFPVGPTGIRSVFMKRFGTM